MNSSNQQTATYYTAASSHEHDKKEDRRRRKIEAARRSRERRKAEHNAVERQVFVNDQRIRFLQGEVDRLSAELLDPPSHADRASRPHWFGQPF